MILKILLLIISFAGMAVTLFVAINRENKKIPAGLAESDPRTHIRKFLFLITPLEKIIFGYFGLIALAYSTLLITGPVIYYLELAVLYLSGLAFFLLIYNFVMGIGTVVKRFKLWVLLCILFSAFIFILVLVDTGAEIFNLLNKSHQYNRTLHLLGLVFGLGGTVIIDLMFTHFLHDYKISGSQSVIMHLISQMIIIGIIILILSGAALFLTAPRDFLESSKFLMKMTAVFIILINGAVLNLYVTPRMNKISLLEEEKGRYELLKKVSFALGATSIVSWVSVFLLAMISEFNSFPYYKLLFAFLMLLALSIVISQLAKKYYEKQSQKINNKKELPY